MVTLRPFTVLGLQCGLNHVCVVGVLVFALLNHALCLLSFRWPVYLKLLD